MKINTIILLALMLSIGLFEVNAQTTWNGTSWDNGTPDWTNSNDDIIITGDLSITFGTVSVGSLTIQNGATLTINGDFEVKGGGDNLTLSSSGVLDVTGDVTFFNGSIVTINDGTAMKIGGNLTNNNNSDDVEFSGAITVDGDLSNGNNGEISNPNGTGTLTVGGTINNNGTIGGSTGDNLGSLPVSLSSFEATHTADGIEIKWITVSEENNSHFEVLKSYDLTTFETIAQVKGAGTSNTSIDYSYIDSETTGAVYYKLKQVDFDGQSEEFEVIKVSQSFDQNNFNIYPNPTSSGIFDLQIKGIDGNEAVSVMLVSMQGAMIYNETLLSNSFGQLDERIDLTDTKGVFTLILKTKEQIIKRHLVSL